MRALLRNVGRLLILGLLVLGVLVVSGKVRLQPVLTGSMAPGIPTGSLVAVVPVDGAALGLGDVIMFLPPQPYETPTGGPVLHRIVKIDRTPEGGLALRTKGDANVAIDPWTIDASAGGIARLEASSLAAGRAVAMVRQSLSGPGLAIWPGMLLLWLMRRRPPAGRARGRYQPRHALTSRVASRAA